MTLELQGLGEVKKAIEELRGHYKPSALRSMLEAPGKLVVKEAKSRVVYPGQIGEAFKRDLSVYRDNRKVARNAEYVLVGPRFRQYSIRGKDRKVALIGQHITLGFRQTDRHTKGGLSRGRVIERFDNPMKEGLEAAKPGINDSINGSIVKNLEKLRTKYSGLVR